MKDVTASSYTERARFLKAGSYLSLDN